MSRGGPGNLASNWKPGQSGNPAGRPKGARSKIAEEFLRALLESFNEAKAEGGPSAGMEAIRAMRDTDPSGYVKTLAALLPKEITGADEAPLFPAITVVFTDEQH